MEYNEDPLMAQTKLKILAVGLAITSDGAQLLLGRYLWLSEFQGLFLNFTHPRITFKC